jgi:hypothetical protein
VGKYQSKEILPITELCHELGLVPNTVVDFFLPFQTFDLEKFSCEKRRGFPIQPSQISSALI